MASDLWRGRFSNKRRGGGGKFLQPRPPCSLSNYGY